MEEKKVVIKKFILNHFNIALQNGWIKLFVQHAAKYQHSVAHVMAIASRETNMSNIRGDYRASKHFPNKGYHGYGIMQVDIGTDPAWIKSGAWKNVGESIARGCKILNDKAREVKALADTQNVKLSQHDFLWIVSASYNHGSKGSFKDFVNSADPDINTTGNDYGADVLSRMEQFQYLLEKHDLVDEIDSALLLNELSAAPSVEPQEVPQNEDVTINLPESVGASVSNDSSVTIGKVSELNVNSAMPVKGGGIHDPAREIDPAQPSKSGAMKAVIATILTALTAGSLDFAVLINNADVALRDKPGLWLMAIITILALIVIHWKYTDRQTQLDLQRERHAHEIDQLHANIAADPAKINVIVKPPQN